MLWRIQYMNKQPVQVNRIVGESKVNRFVGETTFTDSKYSIHLNGLHSGQALPQFVQNKVTESISPSGWDTCPLQHYSQALNLLVHIYIPWCIRSGVPGRGVLPIMTYTGRLRPKGVPFSGFRYINGQGFHKLRYIKGQENWSFRQLEGLLSKIFQINTPYGCISLLRTT